MYANQRCVQPHISYDSVMRDVMTETRDLRISIVRVSMSRMRLSHIVAITTDNVSLFGYITESSKMLRVSILISVS
jgi:hypothetical protein